MRFISHLILTTETYISEIYIGDESYDINQLLDMYQTDNFKYKTECYFLYENKNLHIKLIFKNRIKNKTFTLEYELGGYEHEYDLLIQSLEYDEYIVVKNFL
jgi:hypothetical protein